MNAPKRLSYTVDEACDVTGFNRNQFYRAIADGDLTTFKVGRRRMVSAKALEDFIKRLESRAQGRDAA
ncbi:hypothetical protein N799_07265 [Lysobacter arseniciresistens ZS79]|uniref:Helix-turn-helix domain-containing protein n=1 Tax=Lysobacter arseniciresistens ZS79 TaxID=913325 RepID=A0A0A0EYQ5_9GAMM|nr:helix-turn-helix domain-containing protein [Lysobacter arseniciresistens]KGM55370.1 hypothetical protein N799_07265 [Lysobacter arseniciresistens ZS79]